MKKIDKYLCRLHSKHIISNKSGMEMVQVAILVAIAVAIGLIFRTSITKFVNGIFTKLNEANF